MAVVKRRRRSRNLSRPQYGGMALGTVDEWYRIQKMINTLSSGLIGAWTGKDKRAARRLLYLYWEIWKRFDEYCGWPKAPETWEEFRAIPPKGSDAPYFDEFDIGKLIEMMLDSKPAVQNRARKLQAYERTRLQSLRERLGE